MAAAEPRSQRRDATQKLQALKDARASGGRQHDPDADELEELRRGARYGALLAVVFWPVFFVTLDCYVVYVADPGAHIAWFGLWRLVGWVAIAVGWLMMRPAELPRWRVSLISYTVPKIAAACITMMAIDHGGLVSPYLQGVSVIVLVQAISSPLRWRVGLIHLYTTAIVFPVILALAALWSPTIAAQWHDGATVARFGENYVMAAAMALMAMLGSHFVWAARRQVYEQRKLGRYRLKMRIGVGGMGEVWMAWDERQKRDVAVKILAAHAAGQAGAQRRFEREVKAAASLSSPHTVRVFDYGASDDGVRYFAMELLVGADLATLVAANGVMPPARAIHFARQACASLREAHARGIVHRDIKPENLFASNPAGQADFLKLLDFGVAKISEPVGVEDATLTQAGWLGGTPAYMAPEVCAGAEATGRSDVYSLGGVIYFLLTGTPPFKAESVGALMMAHIHQAPDAPSKRATVSADVDALVLRCLAKSPEDRFADVDALDTALARLEAEEPWTEAQAKKLWSGRLPVID